LHDRTSGVVTRDLRAAAGFLTSVPVGAAPPGPGTLAWFPVVGVLVGLAVGGAWWAAGEAFPLLVAAGVAVLVDVVLTGALHLDGLADTADGVLPHVEGGAASRQAIMAAPDVGAFGVVSVAVALLLRVSALASIEPDPWLVAGLWSGSRTAMALALAAVPYVGGGLGSSFGRSPVAVWGVFPAVALCAIAGIAGIAALVALGVAATLVVLLARARLGGVTGDVLGAAGVAGETVALVIATASW
jgi:adenosylcobinamide-GDP ribazoletransferase